MKVKVRDAKFRDLIFGAEPACLVTGETNIKVLEAAHIDEVQSDGRERWENGIILRVDIHKLFDKHILTVNADGKFTMNPVPSSYEYLFEEDKKTWKGKQPSINADVLNRYIANIKKRNNLRKDKQEKG